VGSCQFRAEETAVVPPGPGTDSGACFPTKFVPESDSDPGLSLSAAEIHLCRFGVRAAMNSLEAFLGSIGSLTSTNKSPHHVSGL